MKCKKCGAELPDLTMYCKECGAPQFEAPKAEVKLEVPGLSKSKVVIREVSNMTNAIMVLRNQSGKSIPEIRKMLAALPADYRVGLTESDAEIIVRDLLEQGVIAEAVHPEGREEISVSAEEPKPVEEIRPVEQLEVPALDDIPETEIKEEAQPELELPLPEETVEIKETAPEKEEEPEAPSLGEIQESEEKEDTQLTLEPGISLPDEFQEEVEALPGNPETSGIQLTLDPEHKLDDAFMKEMEDFLNENEDK